MDKKQWNDNLPKIPEITIQDGEEAMYIKKMFQVCIIEQKP